MNNFDDVIMMCEHINNYDFEYNYEYRNILFCYLYLYNNGKYYNSKNYGLQVLKLDNYKLKSIFVQDLQKLIEKYIIKDLLKISNYYENQLQEYINLSWYEQNIYFQKNFKLKKSYNLIINEKQYYIIFLKKYNLYYDIIKKQYFILFESDNKILYDKSKKCTNTNKNITFLIPFLTNNYNNEIIFELFIKYKKYYTVEIQNYYLYDILNIFSNSKFNKNYESQIINHDDLYTLRYDYMNLDTIINFNEFTNHTENDKLILYFLDLIKHSNIKYLCCNILKNILLFLINDKNIINEIYKDL